MISKKLLLKLSGSLASAALLYTSASYAAVVDQGHGKVTFTGSIVDAPCSIAAESLDQTIPLGAVSNVALKNGGKSKPVNFYIKLENCELNEKDPGKNNTVSLKFTGAPSAVNDKLLGITGTAKGAGVAITDSSGNDIKFGELTSARTLQNGPNTLNFAAYLQGASASSAVIVPGEFQAVTDFTLSYQ